MTDNDIHSACMVFLGASLLGALFTATAKHAHNLEYMTLSPPAKLAADIGFSLNLLSTLLSSSCLYHYEAAHEEMAFTGPELAVW